MQTRINDDQYITKEGIIKNKPRKSKNSFRADPKLDAEFGRFVSYLRNYVKGFPNKKIERYFNGYINRMEKIKKITIEKNVEWEGDLE